jgi:hypothetical protein
MVLLAVGMATEREAIIRVDNANSIGAAAFTLDASLLVGIAKNCGSIIASVPRNRLRH